MCYEINQHGLRVEHELNMYRLWMKYGQSKFVVELVYWPAPAVGSGVVAELVGHRFGARMFGCHAATLGKSFRHTFICSSSID